MQDNTHTLLTANSATACLFFLLLLSLLLQTAALHLLHPAGAPLADVTATTAAAAKSPLGARFAIAGRFCRRKFRRKRVAFGAINLALGLLRLSRLFGLDSSIRGWNARVTTATLYDG